MKGFTKVTDKYGRYLSGREKAAILMSELGVKAGEGVADYLSTKELRTLSRQMKKLGDSYNLMSDLQVLEETNRWGEMKGIVPRVLEKTVQQPAVSQNPVAEAIKSNPEALAKVLSQWLSAEE